MSNNRCPSRWHLSSALREKSMSFSTWNNGLEHFTTTWDHAIEVLGGNPWEDDDIECPTRGQARALMGRPAEATKPHPPIKANRRHIHRKATP